MKTGKKQKIIRLATLLFALCISSAKAQLPYYQSAQLEEHLVEVNSEWRLHLNNNNNYTEQIAFKSEADRIQKHLECVIEIAQNRASLNLKRKKMLDHLRRYAENQKFPTNHLHMHRQPYFIDFSGTACAVGHLLIESGHESLAKQIQFSDNYSYIRQMRYAEIHDWAEEYGFGIDELALIQPGYPPTTVWNTMGTGTDGQVDQIISTLNDESLIICGEFSTANGTSVNQVVHWSNDVYSPLGGGVDGQIRAATWFENDLYLGGTFTDGAQLYDLARWNGTVWSLSTVFSGKYSEISSFAIVQDSLYASGFASGFAGNTHLVAKFTGNSWQWLNGNFDDEVLSLTEFNGTLIAGGAFETNGANVLNFVAAYENNSWTALDTGLDNQVRKLFVHRNQLIAGGDFRDKNDSATFALAAFDGSHWKNLINSTDYPMWGTEDEAWIDDIAAHGDDLYVSGRFEIQPFGVGTFGSNIGRLDSTAWGNYLEALAVLDSAVHSIEIQNDRLYMGGAFEMLTFSQPANHLAYLILESDSQIVDGTASLPAAEFRVFPNPVSREFVIEADQALFENSGQLHCYDLNGKEVPVHYTVFGSNKIHVNKLDLPNGNYLLNWKLGKKTITQGKFLVNRE